MKNKYTTKNLNYCAAIKMQMFDYKQTKQRMTQRRNMHRFHKKRENRNSSKISPMTVENYKNIT